MKGNCSRTLRIIFVAVTLALLSEVGVMPARANDNPDAGELFNYSFAVWIGSGLYKLTGADKRAAILRIPMAYTLRPAQYDKERFRDRLGFRLLLPALVGAQEETDTDFLFGAVAFVPGLEVQIPVNKYWTLKPFGQAGAGKDTAGGSVNYIYGAGARSLIRFPWKKFNFGIGNSMIWAKDKDASSDDTSGFSMLEAGLDVIHPIGLSLFNRKLDLGVFFVASWFRNRVDFLEDSDDTDTARLRRVHNVGLTLGSDDPLPIWKFSFKRVGINYRWGNSGFRGIGFNMGFPF